MAAAPTLVVLGLALLVSACTDPLEILGPTPAGEGITIYLHADYAGPSQAINHDVRDLEKVEGPCTSGAEGEQPTWSDCMSSVRVEPGWAVTLRYSRFASGGTVVSRRRCHVPASCAGGAGGAETRAVTDFSTLVRLPATIALPRTVKRWGPGASQLVTR